MIQSPKRRVLSKSRTEENGEICDVRFEVLPAVIRKNAIFWDVTQCSCCRNRRFGGTYRLHHQGDSYRRTKSNVSSNQRPSNAAKYFVSACFGC
jgi:hypothetical protein